MFIPRDFVLMKSSTKDKIKGGFREAKGKVKEKAGNATGNPNLRDRGTAEKAGGKVKSKIGDLRRFSSNSGGLRKVEKKAHF
jgi:uncharacterized protein YjbJ (UPF0337 family)